MTKEKEEKGDKKEKKSKKKKADKSSSSSSSSSSSGDRKKRKRSKSARKTSPKAEDAKDADSEDEVGPDEFMIKLDMSKAKKGLGIEVDWANKKSLLIKSVKPEGAVPDWNKDRPPNQTVMAEDHVLAVNGKAGDPKAMLNECRTSKKLKMLIWAHCARSSIPAIEKEARSSESAQQKRSAKAAAGFDSRKLADAEAQLQESLARVQQKRNVAAELNEHLVSLDMRRHTVLGLDVDWTNGKLLYIKALQPGAIEEWNRANPPDRAVQPGDTVVAVNGYAGDARGMAGLCKELCGAQSQLQLRVRGPPPPPPTAAPKLQICS